jgi:ABC-2 type transport system permease protein
VTAALPPTTARRRTSPLPLAAWAFARKEALDVLRQPRLLLTLVLGPFAILLIFGLGYSSETRPFRTIFVGDPSAALTREMEASASRLGPLVELDSVETDEAAARERLADGEVDAVVVLPSDPLGTVLGGHRATLRILHDRLDPVELTVIRFASRLAVAEVNAAILASLVSGGQAADLPVREALGVASQRVGEALQQIDANDLVSAEETLGELDRNLSTVDLAATSAAALADDGSDGGGTDATLARTARSFGSVIGSARSAVEDARQVLGSGEVATAKEHLTRAQEALERAPALAEGLLSVDAQVLVQPFEGEVESIVQGERTFTDYYAPAAIVLLLQQFGVAFAALSFVRERQLGASELFRVAPVGPRQVVFGKYVGHLVIGALVAAALVALVCWALDVPLVGSAADLAISLLLLVLASVGLGFVVSLTSRTDMQAVLSTMLVLLAALFFSGFFLPVDQLDGVGRAVARAIPATYGIEQARDIMLRGDELPAASAIGLGVYAAVAAVVVFLLTKRRMTVLG